MIDILLINGYVITMNPEREIIEGGAVAINDGIILDIGLTSDIKDKYEAKKTIDCKKHVIMPGFIDAHGHGGHSMFKGIGLASLSVWMKFMTQTYKHYVTDDFWYYEGKLSSLERLKAGVTTGTCVLGSMPRADDPIFALNHAKGYNEVGVKEIVCTGPCHPEWPHPFSRWIDGKKVTRKVTFDEVMNSTEAVIEALNHANDDKTRAFVAPFTIITSIYGSGATPADQLFALSDHDKIQAKRVREIAKKYNTRIHSDAFGGMVHLAIKDTENALLGPDVHLQHCRGLSFDEIQILAETGTNVSSAPGFGQVIERFQMIEFMNLGGTVAISTDGTAPSVSFDMFRAMRATQAYHRGIHRDSYYLPDRKVLEMTTIDAAKCVGMNDEIGSLEIGKRADIITVNMNQPHLAPNNLYIEKLVHYAVASDVNNVIIDGKLMLENGNVITVDQNKIIEEADFVANATIDRAGLRKLMKPAKESWGATRGYVDEVRFIEDEY